MNCAFKTRVKMIKQKDKGNQSTYVEYKKKIKIINSF